ncbi:uncharacterized protein LOC142617365 [Castanea sativa]|uniref:uncharacterized protein LOC142617365 n=1 Tax=Castanea sativa TaxID=21020 RepID=UPI003F64B689
MRIRKNAKLSPLWFSHASAPESLQAHVCQLNQSPWDVLPLTHQFEGDDSLTGNASLGDSIGAVESVASMMDAVAAKAEDMVLAVNDNDVVEKKGKVFDQKARENEFGGHGFEKVVVDKRSSSCCQKTDGKGWQCRNEAKEGQSLCEHHLNLLRSYNTSNSNSSISFRKSSAAAAAAAAAAAGARRARARAAKKGSSSASNPYEFYYYSGFGPLWGRKRGDRSGGGGGEDGTKSTHQEATAKVAVAVAVAGENVNNNNNNNSNNSVSVATPSSTPSSSSQFDNEEFDYVDDDDEDDGGDSGKKRMRKPVKARSLKSLM